MTPGVVDIVLSGMSEFTDLQFCYIFLAPKDIFCRAKAILKGHSADKLSVNRVQNPDERSWRILFNVVFRGILLFAAQHWRVANIEWYMFYNHSSKNFRSELHYLCQLEKNVCFQFLFSCLSSYSLIIGVMSAPFVFYCSLFLFKLTYLH